MSSFIGVSSSNSGGGGSSRSMIRPARATNHHQGRHHHHHFDDNDNDNDDYHNHNHHGGSSSTIDPDSIMVRSLRRQFYEALSCDDAERAMEVYMMTRTQYLEQFAAAAPSSSSSSSSESTTTTSRRHHHPHHQQQSHPQHAKVAPSSPSISSPSSVRLDKTPILAEIMNPLDPFQPDDARSHLDKYDNVVVVVEPGDNMAPLAAVVRPAPPPRSLSTRLLFRRHHRGGDAAAAPPVDPPAMGPGATGTTNTTHMNMSTPLHQAARLGSLDLLRVFLAVLDQHHYQDLDVRDGQGRTVLHCLAGSVGGLPPVVSPPVPPSSSRRGHRHGTQTTTTATKRLVDALLLRRRRRRPGAPAEAVPTTTNGSKTPPHHHHAGFAAAAAHGQADRVQMAHLLLSYNNISTNAVDKSLGRTALHYAAERQWSVLCDVLLQTSAFDTTMLTVVDASGRTPAELAAASAAASEQHGHGHHNGNNLAASLEAKCLLAVDPYGTMADQFGIAGSDNNNSNNNNNNTTTTLANPFGWFETDNVRRRARIQQAWTKIRALTQDILTRKIHLSDDDLDPQHQAAVVVSIDPPTTEEPQVPRGYYDLDDYVDGLVQRPPPHGDASDGGDDATPSAVATPVERELAAIPDSHLLLHLHEAHVEQLLEYYQWNVKEALQKFFANPFETLTLAGIDLKGYDNVSSSQQQQQQPKTCQICYEENVADDEWQRLSGCGHGFCKDCLHTYVEDRVTAKQSRIVCPHYDCPALLSPSELHSLLPNESKWNAMADERFVMSCPDYRYCPEPGCGRPVRINLNAMPGSRTAIQDAQDIVKLVGAVCTYNPNAPIGSPLTYEGVPDPNYYSLTVAPRRAHRFCFVCGDRQIHWPVDCKKLKEWKATMKQYADEAGINGDAETNHDDIAQSLWLKTNTRPCPKCNAPIQKNEGCNHMTCLNPHCKHEFCWICRNDWKKHNTATGGFFRCNRWAEENDHQFYDGAAHNSSEVPANPFEDLMDPRTLEVTYGTAMHESRAARERTSKMDRFIHHYQRWSAHRDSAALERHMWEEAVPRLAPVVDEMLAFTGSDHLFGGKGLSFIHAAFMELLESRSMLQHSYAFSYLRYMSELRRDRYGGTAGWKRREKSDFERAQSELELLTEQISDVVARKHIRATQEQIVYLTKATAQKRNDFSNTMVSCLKAEAQEEQQKQQRTQQQETNDGDAVGGSGLSSTATTRESPARALLRQSLGDLLAENGLASLLEYDSDDDHDDDDRRHNGLEDWMCPACTFVNTGRRRCEMCNGHRPR